MFQSLFDFYIDTIDNQVIDISSNIVDANLEALIASDAFSKVPIISTAVGAYRIIKYKSILISLSLL